MSNFGGGFDNSGGGTPSSESKPKRNYDEQTLIPCTLKMIADALSDPSSSSSGGGGGDLTLKDGRPLHMVKIVAAVRSHEERSTNVFIDVEDGTGFGQVKVWVNDGDECSAITNLRNGAGQDHTYIRIVGQIREFDGTRQIVANDVRPVTSGNELTHHFLEVAHSHEKGLKAQQSQAMGGGGGGMMGIGGGGMGIGIGSMASNVPRGGNSGMGMGAQQGGMGGGGSLNDAVIECIKAMGQQSDSGCHVSQITEQVSPKGFSESEIRNAINSLSNEGHIYSTIDEEHYQYAE